MWEVKPAQLFMLGLFVLGFIILMLTWWTSREKTGDTLYWTIAAITTGIGAIMIRTGHAAWLNLEMG